MAPHEHCAVLDGSDGYRKVRSIFTEADPRLCEEFSGFFQHDEGLFCAALSSAICRSTSVFIREA